MQLQLADFDQGYNVCCRAPQQGKDTLVLYSCCDATGVLTILSSFSTQHQDRTRAAAT